MASLQYAQAAGINVAATGADSFWVFVERACRLHIIQNAIRDDSGRVIILMRMTSHGITFGGKAITDPLVRALKTLIPFVLDAACKQAYLSAEPFCPELKNVKLLKKVAQQCNTRVVGGGSAPASGGSAQARAYMAFIFDTFRVARLTGEFPKDEPVSVTKILGQDHKSAGWVHIVFKKQEFIEFIMHESALLIDSKMVEALEAFATPCIDFETFLSHWRGRLG